MVSSLSVDVLIVDDSVVDLRLLMHMMETQDLTFAVAQDPFSGFDKAKELLPGLILLDVRMSGMDGYQLCRLLKSDPTTRHIPVIFLTAASDLQERLYGFCAGGVDYISKPFSPEEEFISIWRGAAWLNQSRPASRSQGIPYRGVPCWWRPRKRSCDDEYNLHRRWRSWHYRCVRADEN